MNISNEKAYEHAQEIQATARDIGIEYAADEARTLDARLRSDVNVSNEDRAQLVFDCFADALDPDLDPADPFDRAFPEFAGLV